MDVCKGLSDWLACSKCPNICTCRCPIETENVIEELKHRFNLLEHPIAPDDKGIELKS